MLSNTSAVPPAIKRLLFIKKVKKLLVPEKNRIPKNHDQSLRFVGSLSVYTTQKGSKTTMGIQLKNDPSDRNSTLRTIFDFAIG